MREQIGKKEKRNKEINNKNISQRIYFSTVNLRHDLLWCQKLAVLDCKE